MSGEIVLIRDDRVQSFAVSNATEVLRQVCAVESRLPVVLPAAWFEAHVPEAMSDWITRNQAPT